jgi:hypothetical protein
MDGAFIAYPGLSPAHVYPASSNYAGFNLETCTGLPPAGVWQTVAGPYLLSNGLYAPSVPTTNGPQQLFLNP